MGRLSFKRHRFPTEANRHAVWLHVRFTLSFRDLEEPLAQCKIGVSYETVRCRTIEFGPQIAANLRRSKAPPSPRWHLDEMVCNINGERIFLRRAVGDKGEVLDLVVQKRRNTGATLKLLKQLRRNKKAMTETIVADGLASCGSALKALRLQDRRIQVDFAGTTALRTRIFGSGNASARCSGSSPCPPPSASSPPPQRSTTRSISNGARSAGRR